MAKNISQWECMIDTLPSVYDQQSADFRHMFEHVNDLLQVSRMDDHRISEHPEWIDVHALIDEVVKELRPLMNARALSLTFAKANVPQLYLDPKMFKEVVENILSNAIKYNRRGGRVTISTYQEHAQVCIKIEDTGIGMSQNDLKKATEKFFRAENALKSAVEGTGLGLYVAKSYLEKWGSVLELSSQLDVGTAVTIKIQVRQSAETPIV